MHMFQHFWTCFESFDNFDYFHNFQLPRLHIFVLESNANIPGVQEKQAKKAVEVEKARRTDSMILSLRVRPQHAKECDMHMMYLFVHSVYIYIYIIPICIDSYCIY